MSLFKEKRILLLAGVSIIAAALLVTPGIRYGIDIAGGSRIVLKLEASQVTIRLATPITSDEPINEIIVLIQDNLLTSAKYVPDSFDREANTVKLEIGRLVGADAISAIIENRGAVLSVESAVSEQTMEGVKRLLETRVDPDGRRGVQSRPMGANSLLFEVPAIDPDPAINLERTKALLGQTGRLEAFIENTLVLTADDIEQVGSIRIMESGGLYKYEVPLRISQEGANKFAATSQGKEDYPFAIYLDRPDDAVLLFNNQLLTNMPAGLTYENATRMFCIATSETHGYNLLVPSIPISKGNLDNETLQTIQEMHVTKSRAIFLGSVPDFSENVTGSIKTVFTENKVEYFPKKSETETITSWLQRACGLRSAPAISPDIAGVAARDVEITGFRGSYETAEREASDLKTVLSQRLPVKVSFVGESSIPARLGAEFAFEVVKAAIAAAACVGVLVYLRYRRPMIVGAIMLTAGSELLITIGIVRVLQTIGLPEIGAILAVIGTGVEQQLIMTDELLRIGLPQAGPRPMSLSGRIGKAFAVIFAAAATTIAAMVTLFFVGYGAMKGFAIVMSIGVLVAILVVLPAFGRIINAIVSREITKAEKTQVKVAQR
jgi:preprotein translocase subunit SecD